MANILNNDIHTYISELIAKELGTPNAGDDKRKTGTFGYPNQHSNPLDKPEKQKGGIDGYYVK